MMMLDTQPLKQAPTGPINIAGKAFMANKYAYYEWLREHDPVHKGKVMVMNCYFLSHYQDCVALLKDKRFVRARSSATGKGGKMPFPMPRSVARLAKSMITEDEPNHRRLRNLVHQAFTPRALQRLETRIEVLTHELLDRMESKSVVNLLEEYALPIPVTVIGEMIGIEAADMPRLQNSMKVLSEGMSGWTLLRTFAWDLPQTTEFIKELIERKRKDPADDILTGLIQAEDAGESLDEEELISMVYLLIFAGYETTVHLITNAVYCLLRHPQSLRQVQQSPELMDATVEECLRYLGPVQGTKMNFATETVEIQGVRIPKGAMVVPLLGAANHDPRQFERPDVFEIDRSPNKHLGFGQGIHYCLGAPLARLETKIALNNLLARFPDLRLALDPEALKLQNLPLWHRFQRMPVILRI